MNTNDHYVVTPPDFDAIRCIGIPKDWRPGVRLVHAQTIDTDGDINSIETSTPYFALPLEKCYRQHLVSLSQQPDNKHPAEFDLLLGQQANA